MQMSPGAGVSRMIEVIQVSILNPHTLLSQNEAKRIVVCFDSMQQKKGKVRGFLVQSLQKQGKEGGRLVQHFVEQGKEDDHMAPLPFSMLQIVISDKCLLCPFCKFGNLLFFWQ